MSELRSRRGAPLREGPLVLALESATIEVAAAVGSDSGVLAAVSVRPGRRHAETLHPAIAAACALAGVELAALAAVAVDVGPGLFTGLRVGVAAAKGLALALELPVVAVSSLEILAYAGSGGVAAGAGGRLVVPVVDVRRGELAWALPGAGGAGSGRAGDGGTALGEARLGAPELLADELATLAAADSELHGPLLLVGDGARRYAGELAALLARRACTRSVEVGGDLLAAPPVVALLGLAHRELENGRVVQAAALAPQYLRGADARINWATRP